MSLSNDLVIKTTEMHTSGEPLRIIETGYPELKGLSVMAKRIQARDYYDHLRQFCMLEPRGHKDMFGAVLVSPEDSDADLGAIFINNGGYSTMCGHATLCLARYAVDRDLAKVKQSPETKINFEVPCGLVRAFVQYDEQTGRTGNSRFLNVPAFAMALDVEVLVPGYGSVTLDIGYGGAFYAIVKASQFNLNVLNATSKDLIEVGMAVSAAVRVQVPMIHPNDPDLAHLHGTILTDGNDEYSNEPTANVLVFANQQVDRSPCGSGTTSRVAVQFARGQIQQGQKRTFMSGNTKGCFTGMVTEQTTCGEFPAVTVEISGKAHYTGQSIFIMEEDDDLKGGFQIL